MTTKMHIQKVPLNSSQGSLCGEPHTFEVASLDAAYQNAGDLPVCQPCTTAFLIKEGYIKEGDLESLEEEGFYCPDCSYLRNDLREACKCPEEGFLSDEDRQAYLDLNTPKYTGAQVDRFIGAAYNLLYKPLTKGASLEPWYMTLWGNYCKAVRDICEEEPNDDA